MNQIIVLATIRREPAIDFQTALAADLAGLTDAQVLQKAAQAGRLLVTHDQRTMPRHFAEFITTEASPRLLIIPQHLPVAAAAEDLVLIWALTEPDEWTTASASYPCDHAGEGKRWCRIRHGQLRPMTLKPTA